MLATLNKFCLTRLLGNFIKDLLLIFSFCKCFLSLEANSRLEPIELDEKGLEASLWIFFSLPLSNNIVIAITFFSFLQHIIKYFISSISQINFKCEKNQCSLSAFLAVQTLSAAPERITTDLSFSSQQTEKKRNSKYQTELNLKEVKITLLVLFLVSAK